MKNALLPGFGGPMGRHARPAGIWFNPVPWAILGASLVFLVCVARQVPCVRTEASNQINAFIRLCYSDVQLMYTGQDFGLGHSPFGGATMLFPPVLAAFVLATVKLAGALGAPIGPGVDLQGQVDGSVLFLAITAVLLFACFLVWVLCMVLLGRDSRNGRYRSWDALIVALSPLVMLIGLVNWDLFPIALCAVGLLLFARRQVVASGIMLGLAAGAGTMSIAVVLAVATAILLRGTLRQLAGFLLPAVAVWVLVHLRLLLDNTDKVYAWFKAQVAGEKSYGSVWYLLQLTGWDVKAAGALGFTILVLVLGCTVAWLYLTHRRPRVGTLVATFVFLTAVLGAAYPPQVILWLLFALVLARPNRTELTWFTVAGLAYFLALHGLLSGHLTAQRFGPDRLYFAILGVRLGVELWLLFLFYRDMARPGDDRLRAPDQSDPIGGVLVDDEELAPVVVPAA